MEESKPGYAFDANAIPAAPDYNLGSSWSVLPDDPWAYPVDVFFVSPSAWFRTDNWNMSVTDKAGKEAVRAILWRQGSIFYGIGNIYAPYYRQAHVYSMMDRAGDGGEALDIAYEDVERAFLRYMAEFNEGRPFILAGHGQGSQHLKRLIKSRFYSSDLRERLIVGYLVGAPITALDLESPHLKVCRNPWETGCVVSWTTEPEAINTLTEPVEVAVNPLTWRAEKNGEYASAALNKGAVFFNKPRLARNQDSGGRGGVTSYESAGATVVPQYTGGQTVRGILVIDNPTKNKDLRMYLGPGNYHAYDYNFFFLNVRQNAAERVERYLSNHPATQRTSLNSKSCLCKIEPGYQ
jgi:hypothetical protein